MEFYWKGHTGIIEPTPVPFARYVHYANELMYRFDEDKDYLLGMCLLNDVERTISKYQGSIPLGTLCAFNPLKAVLDE